MEAREAQELPVPVRRQIQALAVGRHVCAGESRIALVRGQEGGLAGFEVQPVEVVVYVGVVAGDDEGLPVGCPARHGMVARDLPHGLRLAVRHVLHENVEIRPVAPGRRKGDAFSIWREPSRIMDGLRVTGKVRNLTIPEQEELRAFVAASVHAEDELVLRRRILRGRDALLVKRQLLGPGGTPASDLPDLGHAGDLGQKRDPLPVRRPPRAPGTPDLQIPGELVSQLIPLASMSIQASQPVEKAIRPTCSYILRRVYT